MLPKPMATLHHIGCSGGKDSTALLLWAIHESGLPRESLRVTFCDTKNEDPLTYQHLDLLRKKVVEPAGIIGGLEVLEPERGFFELALWKHRFPSRRAQFCTQHLKLFPTQEWVRARQREDFDVVVLNGKRSGESEERRRAMEGKADREWSPFWGCEEWAAISAWTIKDVLAIHQRHGVPLNPLYALGAARVGCFPCVNCGKREIRMVAELRPEKIDQIDGWEKSIEAIHGRPATFFASKVATPRFRTKRFEDANGKVHQLAPIREIVQWANTTRGGEQFRLPIEEPKACWANYGACE